VAARRAGGLSFLTRPHLRHCTLAGLHLVLLSFLASGVGSAGAAPVQVDPAFGYRIGDQIVAVGKLSVDDSAKLKADSIPRTGRVNGWLSLEEIRLEPVAGGLRVVRTFRVTASAPEPRMLFLPKAALKFTIGNREIEEQLESVPISVSPLSPAEPVLRTGFGALRPDRDVPDPDARQALRRARMLAAALAVLALLWAAVRGFAMRRRGFAPFAVAAKRLRRLPRLESGPDAARRGYRILHDAFNEAAGQAVFASHKERFLATHPRFAAEADAVRAFFGPTSTEQPVAEGAGPHRAGDDVAWLADLARRLARIEQPGR
jgi:mxaA protein